MMQTELLQKDFKTVGEAISHELGAQMVKDYQVANPNDVKSYYIGRNILDQIMAQPGCVGVRFYNAYNEEGKKTLVYVAVDATGNDIAKYSIIDNNGKLVTMDATVGDRAQQGAEDSSFSAWDAFWEWLLP
jgi:hypothetical protein